MNRFFLTVCGVVFVSLCATNTLIAAGNINVELSDEGVLAIVGERGPDTPLDVDVRVYPGGTVWIAADGSTVNGQSDPVTYDLNVVAVTEISISLVPEVYVWVSELLAADLSISDCQIVSIDGGSSEPGIIYGDTTIATGLGADAIYVSEITLVGNVDFTSGHGGDLIYIGESYFAPYFSGPVAVFGHLSINTGHGKDYIVVPTGALVDGEFQLELGQDDDSLSATRMTVHGNAYLSGGQGDDVCKDPTVEGELFKIGFED